MEYLDMVVNDQNISMSQSSLKRYMVIRDDRTLNED